MVLHAKQRRSLWMCACECAKSAVHKASTCACSHVLYCTGREAGQRGGGRCSCVVAAPSVGRGYGRTAWCAALQSQSEGKVKGKTERPN